MTLRDIVEKLPHSARMLADISCIKEYNYELEIYDIDLNKALDIDLKLYIDNTKEKLTLKVEG